MRRLFKSRLQLILFHWALVTEMHQLFVIQVGDIHLTNLLIQLSTVAHYNDVIMGTMTSQITIITIVYSAVYSGADQRKYQSSASLDFVTGEFPAQMASNAENVSIWWRHHGQNKTYIHIQTFWLKYIRLNMSPEKCWLFYVGVNGLQL